MQTLTASILLPAPAQRDEITALIHDSFSTMETANTPGDPRTVFDGTIEQRRFLVAAGPEYEERFEDLDREGLAAAFGLAPVDEIRVIALHKKHPDQLLLARLAMLLAAKFNGIVDLHGKPWIPPDVLKAAAGRYVTLRRFDAGEPLGTEPACGYGDALFLKAWLNHPTFKWAS